MKQAKLQEEKRLTKKVNLFLVNDDKKGFYKMPEPNEGDIFYDIEGFPQQTVDRSNIFMVSIFIMEQNLSLRTSPSRIIQ